MAINNANQFLGYHTDYSDTSHHLNNHSEFTTLADGQLGMNPLVVGTYYRSLGCQVKCFSTINVIPKTYDAYIMLYFYEGIDKNGNDTLGAHYIAVSYNPSTDKFTAYNNNYHGQIEQQDGFSLRINVGTLFGELITRINRKTSIPTLAEEMTGIDWLMNGSYYFCEAFYDKN